MKTLIRPIFVLFTLMIAMKLNLAWGDLEPMH